jgi:hypothetical protein
MFDTRGSVRCRTVPVSRDETRGTRQPALTIFRGADAYARSLPRSACPFFTAFGGELTAQRPALRPFTL